MLTNKRYEEVIEKARPSLRAKIEHSVELLRKAERLALIYDPNDGFFLAFSAGKDSQALYHIAEIAGVKFKAHMNLTSVDPPEVIRFAKTQYPEVNLKRPPDSLFNIAVKKGILPTMKLRFCCRELKETAGAGKVTLIGIRHSESNRRARRNEVEISDHKYSGTLEGLDEYRRNKRGRGRPRKSPKPEPFSINTADRESQAGCISGKESLLISPIIDWDEKDVWDFLRIMGVPHCPLYDEGWKRLGCIGCPMTSPKMKAKENVRWPHVRRNWIKAIIAIRRGGGHQKGVPTTRPTSEYGQETSSKIRGGRNRCSESPSNGCGTEETGRGLSMVGESGRTTQRTGSITKGTEGRCSEGISPIAEAGTRRHLRGRYGMDFYNRGGLLEAPTLDMSLRKSGLPETAIGGGANYGWKFRHKELWAPQGGGNPQGVRGTATPRHSGANSDSVTRTSNGATSIGGGTGNQLVSNGNPEQKGSARSETLCPQTEDERDAVPHKRSDVPDWCTEEEWEIAENIYDWWISGVSYEKWYNSRFNQKKLEFKE